MTKMGLSVFANKLLLEYFDLCITCNQWSSGADPENICRGGGGAIIVCGQAKRGPFLKIKREGVRAQPFTNML